MNKAQTDKLVSKLNFKFSFRRYQQQILDSIFYKPNLKAGSSKFINDTRDKRFHIVAPPGSGKTVVGIELIKLLSEPAVVFVPNTTIQLQWKQQVKLFLSTEDEEFFLDEIVSTDPNNLKLINIFTYQLISTTDQQNDFLDSHGLELWKNTLIENRVSETTEEALKRITLLKKKSQRLYSREIGKYKKQAKNYFLNQSIEGLDQILHPNAQKLIKSLVDHGVKTIVLDEVHHLLDYWAVVINALANKIDDEHLVGLTATPPRSASSKEKENYLNLMGEIDYQIPIPAVVKEGSLAPYQDLIYLCSPTKQEKEFIDNIQLHFENFIESLSNSELFEKFIMFNIFSQGYYYLDESLDNYSFSKSILDDNLSDEDFQNITLNFKEHTPSSWSKFFNKNPVFSTAMVKYALLKKIELPSYVVIIPEMKSDISLDDWSVLLKKFSLDFLKLSSEKEHHQMLSQIKATLRMFGYSLTESGIKPHRSPTDLIFSFSKAKNNSVVKILKTEIDSMKESLRAVVITDFEKMNVRAQKKVNSILDKDAGGAVGIFRSILEDKKTTKLEPILITGKNVLVDSDELPVILKAMKIWIKKHVYNIKISAISTEFSKIKKIEGSGKDWKSSVYVRMVTDIFEQGITKCIVGTRGLIGEGWNSLSVNTLLDLTNVTTSTSTNQIRGRALRKDPSWPNKLSNIWYVACLDNSFEKGDRDFKRLIKKHKHFYGLSDNGEVVKGMEHIDERVMLTLKTKGFKHIVPRLINRQMLAKSRKRASVYKKWRIGEPYKNIEVAGISLNRKKIEIRTAYSLKNTSKSISIAVVQSVGGFSFWYAQNFYQIFKIPFFHLYSDVVQKIGLLVFLIILQAHSGYKLKKLYIKVLTQIPVDNYVKDIAITVLIALQKLKLISSKVDENNIHIKSGSKGRVRVEMTNIDTTDSRLINKAMSDIFSSVTDQRYLIERTLDRMPLGLLSPVWWIIYSFLKMLKLARPTYHPVPDIFAINRKRANIFAKSWSTYVGGGNLVYTRSSLGSRKLLNLRQKNNHEFEKMTYEVWQ